MTFDSNPTSFLSGHSDEVICLSTCSHAATLTEISQLLASGSEDATARIWDVRNGRVVKAFKGFEEAVTSVRFAEKGGYLFYLSSGRKLYSYDLRKPDHIYTESEDEFSVGLEEINQICIDEKNKYLALGDDNGEVHVIDLSTKKIHKNFRSKHQNICMSVAFRSRRPWEVWSGGLDSQVIAWDFSRGSPSNVFNMNEAATPAPETSQLFNPPFVYSLSAAENGRVVAAGLGNGTVRLLLSPPSKKDGEWRQETLSGGHSYTVSALDFARFSPSKLLSAGSDGTISIWTVPSAMPTGSTSAKGGDVLPSHLQHTFKSPNYGKIECIASSLQTSGGNVFVAGLAKAEDAETRRGRQVTPNSQKGSIAVYSFR